MTLRKRAPFSVGRFRVPQSSLPASDAGWKPAVRVAETLSPKAALARWVAPLGILVATGCAGVPGTSRPLAAGQDMAGPWYMQQTALTRDGRLDLKSKPWWPKAAALKLGEQFSIDAAGEAAGRMIVRREEAARRTGAVEAIVWVIDDDGDGSAATGGDNHSDCYVVDYGGDGTVDRMVDYIDNDSDRIPDEMDIRYFEQGQLRSVWCGLDLDGDGSMWDLAGYEYSADFFRSDPYGNNMIYMNKFNPQDGTWVPISECPFAFYDTDGDGYSEVVVRFSAAPIDYDTGTDPDYANDARRYRGAWSDDMQRMGVVNIRYSFDIDNVSSRETPLHYDFGFNMVGATPYRFAGMYRFNPRRRPPQVTCVAPFDSVRGISDRYAAKETGFTWHEQHDDTIAIGDGPQKDLDFRWEGVFWIWERRFMGNTGGPGQKWNVRREWSGKPANRRELYYSEVDRRIHLFGAEEGWIQIGHFAGQGAIGELRMFDTDGNGCFDRWEVYLGDDPVPVRVTTVRDERARRIPFDCAWLNRFYTQDVLPDAMAANAKLMEAMQRVRPFDVPAPLRTAMSAEVPGYQRYAQDVVRELQYQALRQDLTAEAHEIIAKARMDDLRPLDRAARDTTRNSQYAWRLLRALEELDVAYGQGRFDRACEVLDGIRETRSAVR